MVHAAGLIRRFLAWLRRHAVAEMELDLELAEEMEEEYDERVVVFGVELWRRPVRFRRRRRPPEDDRDGA